MKDYYAILGVPQDETPEGIRSAYRDAVRRTHPDHAGEQSTADFRDIIEAHSVLSDPDRRREYNQNLRESQPRYPAPHVYEQSGSQRDGFRGPSLEIVLTPDEAIAGGILSLAIPVQQVCRACGGAGWDWFLPCAYCGGQGAISTVERVNIPIPDAIRFGRQRQMSLGTIPVEGIQTDLRISVSSEHF